MKQIFLQFLKNIILRLEKIHFKFSPLDIHNISYSSLSPVSDADEGGYYTKTLTWALKNRKENDIKNIALTGPYGSGKSSILKTFQKKYLGNDFHFLSISLATFKDEKIIADSQQDDGLLRLIELSILQQIFYHESDEKIPDSRLKKIKRYSNGKLALLTTAIVIYGLAAFNLYKKNGLYKIFQIPETEPGITILYFSSLAILFILSVGFIYRTIRILLGVKVKLSFDHAEIEIDEGISKSILNHHIDEILYFFEVTKYNVVIIEDLDRFENTEIFTKLREINLLLNNSKKVGKEVVFIYAVKDDMFKDKDRAKFFDFIIPVIPIINSSNSSEKLLEKTKQNNYRISEDLIEDISLFVDDMRLLHNIMNEFYLYSQKIGKNLIDDKLLAILVYKNIFPNDFSKLNSSEGDLYGILSKKNDYIENEILKANTLIDNLKGEIRELEDMHLKNIEELRSLYLLQYISHLNYFESFEINGQDKNILEMLEDDNFGYLINNSSKYKSMTNYGSIQTKRVSVEFNTIENEIGEKKYLERESEIGSWRNGRVDVLKKEIQDLENAKVQIRNSKIQFLFSSGHFAISNLDAKQNSLINILIRNGYIDEDYHDYISIFYEGSITKADQEFLLSVKSQNALEFDYGLSKIDKLLSKIHINDFSKEYVLNYGLVDFILKSNQHHSIRDSIFNKLKDETSVSVNFIDGYITRGRTLREFTKILCRAWVGIWNFVDDKSNYTEDKKNEYFKLIIEFADLGDIKKISVTSTLFINSILGKMDFLTTIENSRKLQSIIKSLDLKFYSLDESKIPSELFDFVYSSGHYKINVEMLKLIIKRSGHLNIVDFDTRNYHAVNSSKCNDLINHINANINEYIEDVYLKLEFNESEDLNSLTALLNNNEISIENKDRIIQKVGTKILDISTINSLEVQDYILSHQKILPTWKNVFSYFEHSGQEITEYLVEFLNIHARELSATKIPKDKENENKYNKFIIKIIKNEEIENTSYDLILNSIPYYYSKLNVNELSKQKVTMLIEKSKISLSKETFGFLKSGNDGLHIGLIEKSKDVFIKTIGNYELDGDDILALLKSDVLNEDEKNTILDEVDELLITSSSVAISEIGKIILKKSTFRVSESILEQVLVSPDLSVTERILIFNLKHDEVSGEYISEFLNSLDEPFSDITINGKRPLLSFGEQILRMVTLLRAKNYISSYTINDKKGIRVSTKKK